MDETMMCNQDREMTMLMSLALDGLLGSDDRQHLDRHLATCPACQAEWQAMQAVSTLFEQSPMVGPPLGFALRIDRKLAQDKKKRRRLFGGVAVFTGSLSLAGLTVAIVAFLVLGVLVWQGLGPLPAIQEGTSALSHLASGMGLVGKGASFFLGDLLLRYGWLLIAGLAVGGILVAGFWTWLFVRQPRNSQRNGYV